MKKSILRPLAITSTLTLTVASAICAMLSIWGTDPR